MNRMKIWNLDVNLSIDKTRWILVLIITVHFLITPGCTQEIDILKGMDKEALNAEIEKLTDSPLKVDILNKLAYLESKSEIDIAHGYGDIAFKMAQEINYPKGIVDSYCNLGLIHYLESDYEESRKYYKKGFDNSEKIKYLVGKAKAYNGIARYHQVKGEYATALENFIKSKDICEAIKEIRELAGAEYGFGALSYYDQQAYEEGRNSFETTLKLGKDIGDEIIKTSAYYAIGEMFQGEGNDGKAKEYFDMCLNTSKENGIKYNMANAYEGIGDISLKKGNTKKKDGSKEEALDCYKDALDNYTNSMKLFLKTKDDLQIAEIYKRLGKLYHQMGDIGNKEENYQKALDCLNRALEISSKKKLPKTIAEVARELFITYMKKNDRENALKYIELFDEKSDFLKKNEMRQMRQLKMFYNFKKEAEIGESRKLVFITSSSVLLIFLLVAVLIALKLAKQKKKLVKSYKDIELMSTIGQLITSSLSKERIYQTVYEHIKHLMDASVFWIYWYDSELKRLVLVGGKENGVENISHSYELTEKNRPTVKCFLEQKTFVFTDYQKEYPTIFGGNPPQPKKGISYNSHIFLPLVIKGSRDQDDKKVGVITVQSVHKKAYSGYHVNILKGIGGYAAIALDNANAYKKIEDQKSTIEEQKVKVEDALGKEKEISDHKDSLMHTVSHQYKTPISIIKKSAEILRDYWPKLSAEEIDDQLISIFKNIQRMLMLIDDLFLFSKKFNPGFYDLSDIFSSFVDEIKTHEGRNHEIIFKDSGKCGKLKVDKDLMKIILHNLIVNAINYSPKRSQIIVDLECKTDHAVITITDRGIGIPEDYFKMKFERFHRGSNVGDAIGTGLGLSIVKRYVDLHKGDIEIVSQLNVGTTVSVKIPQG